MLTLPREVLIWWLQYIVAIVRAVNLTMVIINEVHIFMTLSFRPIADATQLQKQKEHSALKRTINSA